MTATDELRRIDELCAENEKLRKALEEEHVLAEHYHEHAQAENAKLRELVADLWEFGFSKNAGANSIKEWVRKSDELRERVYEALGVDA